MAEVVKQENKNLPNWIMLNPRLAVKFDDQLSGVNLNMLNIDQFYCKTPKHRDCTRVRQSLAISRLVGFDTKKDAMAWMSTNRIQPPLENPDEQTAERIRQLLGVADADVVRSNIRTVKDMRILRWARRMEQSGDNKVGICRYEIIDSINDHMNMIASEAGMKNPASLMVAEYSGLMEEEKETVGA